MANDTGPVRCIAIHATAETAPPSGTKGSAVTWAGWTVIGSKDRGDNANLDAKTIEIKRYDEVVKVRPPLSQTNADVVVVANGADEITFECYGLDADAFALDSCADNDDSVGTTLVYRSLAIEIAGAGVDWYPRVKLSVIGASAGVDTAGSVKMKAVVCKPTSGALPAAGWKFVEHGA